MSDAKIDEDLKAIVRRALEKMTKEHNLVWNATGPGKVQQILSEDEEVIKKFTQLMSLLASMTSALLRSRSDLLKSPPPTAAPGSGSGESAPPPPPRPVVHHLHNVPLAPSEPNASVGEQPVASIGDLPVFRTDRITTNQEAAERPNSFGLPEMTPAPMLDGQVHSHAPNPPITDGSSFPPSGTQSQAAPPSNVRVQKPGSPIQQTLEARNPDSTPQVSPSYLQQPRHQGRSDGSTNKPPPENPAAYSSYTKASYQKPPPAPAKIPNKPIFKVLPMQSKEYSLPLADAIDCTELKRRLGVADLNRMEIRFPEELGLAYHRDSMRIAGTPKKSGEFDVEFTVVDRELFSSRSFREKLLVNPDPESLWNNLGSADNFKGTPGWKEDKETMSRKGVHGRILAARTQGKSHAHVGSPCDDDMFVEIQDRWHILIVADGAGSAKLSRLGSQLAVQAAGRYLVDEFAKNAQMASYLEALDSEEPKQESLKTIAQISVGMAAHTAFIAIYNKAKAEGYNQKDLSTTLLVGLACPLRSGRWFVCTFWIGDGALGVHRHGQAPILFGAPDSGEYSGQTRFLDAESVSTSLEARTRFQLVDRFDAFVLMTDGVSDPKFETEARLGDKSAWEEFWTNLDRNVSPYDDVEKASGRLLSYLGFKSPGNHDDRTIAILLPTGAR